MLIGSRAIAHWNKDFKVKPGADWDIIGHTGDDYHFRRLLNIPEEDRIEWHSLESLNNHILLDTFDEFGVCSLYGLAIIYRSHLHRDWNWDAHITKYYRFILPMVSDHSRLLSDPLLLERIKLTKKAFPQGNPKLNKSNDEFFDDPVNKVYDHDFLHELYAYEDRPMFERLKRPEQFDLAWCAKDLWEQLSHTQKLQCVAEETFVIATERFMVPNNWDFATKRAYYFALKKVCTTLTSGWFRDFAIDNFPAIFEMYQGSKFYMVQAHVENVPKSELRFHKQGEM